MTRPAYYNETDPFCAGVLQRRIADGSLPLGDVDTRDVRDVAADDLRGYGQIHLFAGIGGFPLGLRMAGVPDGRSIFTGGFPCQPWSVAGERRGHEDDRDLWPEMARLIAGTRPDWVLGENVPGLINAEMGLDRVLSDLESAGYAARSFSIPACAVDAPHRRERLWIVAHGPDVRGRQEQRMQPDGDIRGGGAVEHAARDGRGERRPESSIRSGRPAAAEPSGAEPVGHTECAGSPQPEGVAGNDGPQCASSERTGWRDAEWIVGADGLARRVAEPSLCRMVNGLSRRVDQRRSLPAEGQLDRYIEARTAGQVSPGEALRELWQAVPQAAAEWPTRGSFGVPAQEILFASLREFAWRYHNTRRASTSTKASTIILRGVRLNQRVARPSCGSQSIQQCDREPTNALHTMSSVLAQLAQEVGQEDDYANAASIQLLARCVPNRVARLRALGNAVVPQVVAEIAGAMMEAERDESESEAAA